MVTSVIIFNPSVTFVGQEETVYLTTRPMAGERTQQFAPIGDCSSTDTPTKDLAENTIDAVTFKWLPDTKAELAGGDTIAEEDKDALITTLINDSILPATLSCSPIAVGSYSSASHGSHARFYFNNTYTFTTDWVESNNFKLSYYSEQILSETQCRSTGEDENGNLIFKLFNVLDKVNGAIEVAAIPVYTFPSFEYNNRLFKPVRMKLLNDVNIKWNDDDPSLLHPKIRVEYKYDPEDQTA